MYLYIYIYILYIYIYIDIYVHFVYIYIYIYIYISESEGSWFKPHQQDVNQKVFPGGRLGNSKTHKKNNFLFEKKKKTFNANNYFMENLTPRNSCFHRPGSCYHQSVTLWQKCGQSHSLNSMQNILEVIIVFQLIPTLYHNHENFIKVPPYSVRYL